MNPAHSDEVLAAIADYLGTTVAEVRRLIASGDIDVESDNYAPLWSLWPSGQPSDYN
jgi:hypothetical protein